MIRFAHIPKTSGYSVYTEFHPRSFNFSKSESCIPYWYIANPDVINGAMFRNPIDHVFSQYKECRYDHWGKQTTSNTKFPRNSSVSKDFDTWLTHFQTPTNDNFNCYHPFNMQTRHLLCNEASGHNHMFSLQMNVSRGFAMLDKLQWVGIQNMYHESICVLKYLHTKLLPKDCDCRLKTKPQHPYVRHGVPILHMNHSKHTFNMIQTQIQYDNLIFEYATQRVLRDIRRVQNVTNQIFWCE